MVTVTRRLRLFEEKQSINLTEIIFFSLKNKVTCNGRDNITFFSTGTRQSNIIKKWIKNDLYINVRLLDQNTLFMKSGAYVTFKETCVLVYVEQCYSN